MLKFKFNRKDNHFIYNNNINEYINYLNNNNNPFVHIINNNKSKIVNDLYDIAFNFKILNIKNPNKILYIYSNKNIYNDIILINNCMSAIDLDILPSNIATPKMLSIFIKKLFKNINGVKIKILNNQQIKKEKLNLIYSVGNGSYNKPFFVIIERLTKNPTTCIIGKGITFDAGGTNIKTNNGIYDMKYDKTGAVYSLFALKYLIETNKDLSLVGLLPFCENTISNNPLKSGDVIKSYSGKTVEVLDTDAEGRLIMADALAYSQKYKPNLLIDIATLTGASSKHNCYNLGTFYTKSIKIKNFIEKISFKNDEIMIGLPTWVKKDMLKSSVADIKNYSLSCHDSYSASMFLHEFIPKNVKNWIHIDLAHAIYKKDEVSIPKGKGIRTLIEIIKKMNK